METELLTPLLGVINRNAAPDNSFKASTWIEAVSKVLEVMPGNPQRRLLTASKVKNKHASFRREFSIWKAVVNQSGFSRDPPESGPVIAPFLVMEAYFSSHPGARKLSLAPIEHEELLTSLFDGRLADGRHSQGYGDLMDLVNDLGDPNSTQLSESDGFGGSDSQPIEEDSEPAESYGARSPAARQGQRDSGSSQLGACTPDKAVISPRSAVAVHHARRIRDPFQDEIGRGMASLVDVLASRNRSIVSAAIEIANRDFTDLPPLQAARLARMLTNTANAEMFVGMTDPAVRAVFISEWLGEQALATSTTV